MGGSGAYRGSWCSGVGGYGVRLGQDVFKEPPVSAMHFVVQSRYISWPSVLEEGLMFRL